MAEVFEKAVEKLWVARPEASGSERQVGALVLQLVTNLADRRVVDRGLHQAAGGAAEPQLVLARPPQFHRCLERTRRHRPRLARAARNMMQRYGHPSVLLLVHIENLNRISGEYGPDEYNKGWWELRERYQGVRALRVVTLSPKRAEIGIATRPLKPKGSAKARKSCSPRTTRAAAFSKSKSTGLPSAHSN